MRSITKNIGQVAKQPAPAVVAKRVEDFRELTRLVREERCSLSGTTFGAYALKGDYVQYYWVDPERMRVNRQFYLPKKRISDVGNGRS
jgi:hypothetical protein